MTKAREWLRVGMVGVAALIGIPIPSDVISLALDHVFSHLDAIRQAKARELSNRAADALLSLAYGEGEGAIESARLTTESLLARYSLSDERFASLALDPARAADAVLASRTFTPHEREILPLCRRLLICFYESLLSDPVAFTELVPHSHREQLKRLGSIESKLDALRADVGGDLAELKGAIKGDDQEFVQKLINRQVDIARRLIEAHRPHAAIELLQGIREVATERLSALLHFRVLSNLGNAHLLLRDARAAGLLFLEASKHEPDNDDQAVAQHAHAHLLLGELDTAERIAGEGAARFPDSGRVKGMQLAIANHRGRLPDPEGAVRHSFRSNFHVAYNVGLIYWLRDDLDAAIKWIKMAHEADPRHWQGRKIFAELLLRRAVDSHFELLGAPSEIICVFR